MRLIIERRARESSYHPMASDSDDGAISDGDPPFYAGSLPPSNVGTPSVLTGFPTRPTSNQDSIAGMTGGAANLQAQPPKSKGKRSFEELEDIVFSNPKSFATLAFAIAESRGVTLVVSDDRTHKVTSAYMHITCAFRKAGCPFILKLTKAKEGGWVLKGAKALEGRAVDIKQRSIYRCRHPAGATPELPTSSLPHPFFGDSTTAYPMASTASGGVSKPKAARVSRVNSNAGGAYDNTGGYEQYASSIGKAAPTTAKGPPRSSGPPAPVGGFGTPRMTPVMGTSASAAALAAAADRALAPPFERSINLQSRIVPVLRGGEPTNGFSAPRGGGSQTGSAYNSPRGSEVTWPAGQLTIMGGGGGESHSYSSLATVPIMAQSDPQALPDWKKLLKLLCPSSSSQLDSTVNSPNRSNRSSSSSSSTSSSPGPLSSSQSKPSLVPLAQILSHPYMSLTPQLFFAPTTTDAMRQEVLDGLPNEKVGVWNKVWAKKVLMSEEAAKRWGEIEEEQKREEEEAKRQEEEEERQEEEDKNMKVVKEEDSSNGGITYGHRSMITEPGGPSYGGGTKEPSLLVEDDDSLYEEEV
ncbi:hypothetical protein JCM5353_008857 [Sporobolomyces roseus]